MKAFIDRRWAEARRELALHDPAYIRNVEAFVRVQGKLILPSQPASSKYTLTDKWIKLIESTVDVSLALEDLDLTVSLLTPNATSREAHWYLDVWKQNAFNLIEKVKVLVSLTCAVHGLGRLRDKYHARLDSKEVQGKISILRHPLVHGAGGEGTVVRRAVTEDLQHPWELSVAIGPSMIDDILAYDHQTGPTSKEWHDISVRHTRTLLGNIGAVLDDLENDMGR